MGLLNNDEGKLVYIIPQDEFSDELLLEEPRKLILTATESFSKTESAVVSNFPVSSGNSHGDHYRFNGAVINFKGVLSPQSLNLIQAITGERLPPLQDYISNVRDVMRMLIKEDDTTTSPVVNIHLPDENSVTNCVITNFKISRDVKVSDGYYVEITAQELLIADTFFSVSAKNDTFTEESNNGSDTPTEATESDIAGKLNSRP